MVFIEAKVVDATHLELTRPLPAGNGRTVLVVVSDAKEPDPERDEWVTASADALGATYGDAEPEYDVSMLRERNAGYSE